MSEIPESREVRLQSGITEGFAESIAMSIYTGGSTELMRGIAGIELTIESARANAARNIARLLKDRLLSEGYLVVSDIDNSLEEFLEDVVDKKTTP